MPRNHIEGAVVLLDRDKPPGVLNDNGERDVQIFVNVSNGVEEVSWVRESMAAKGAQVWEFPFGAPDLGDMASSHGCPFAQIDPEAYPTLDHTDLARLHEELAHLSLHVEDAQLRRDEEVSVSVTIGLVFHVGIDHVDIEGKALLEVRVATATEGMETVGEVNLLVILGQRERRPLGLLW